MVLARGLLQLRVGDNVFSHLIEKQFIYHLVYNLRSMCPMAVLTTRAVYKDGVLRPTTKLDLPDGATAEVQISALPLAVAVDPKDALLDDEAALQAMYSEFAEEEMF